MGKWLAAMAFTAAALPGVALAEHMSYAFVQLNGIFDAEADLSGVSAPATAFNGTFDGDGVGFEAGWIYGPYAFSDVRYDDYDLDGDTEGQELSARLGVRSQLPLQGTSRMDAYGAISFEDVEFERNLIGTPGVEVDENGFGVHAGLRFAPIKQVELNGELSYMDLGDVDGQFGTLGVQWNVSEYFALNLRYRTGDYDGSTRIAGVKSDVTLDVDSLRLGVRLQWGGG